MDIPKFTGFEIIEMMPHGGMSTVYKARQISLDRLVALKTLPLSLAAESADIHQFLTEARITANLKHPNIVQVYDFGKTEEGIYYFVMEFVSGYSVGDWIRRKRCLTEENSLLVAQSVAEALDYAWKTARVIHCDIKPDNVIIDGDGTVKVADLGLAKSVRSVMDRTKISDGMAFGTPNYISPEQSRGDADLDCRADIYSLGATLYHCMTGKMPFEGVPPLVAMDRQIADQIPDAQDINPRISTEAVCLIEKMMGKDRAHRQPDWNAVLLDIRRLMTHQMPVGDLPPKGASTMQRSAQRGLRPRLKISTPTPASIMTADMSADSHAFQKMERLFALKQKRRLAFKPEWWFAGFISVAVIVLGVLVGKNVFLGGRPSAPDVKPPVEGVSQGLSSQGVSAAQAPPEKTVMSLEDNAKGMFEFAMKWAQDNPSLLDEAIHQFEKVATETTGTEYSLMATMEIQNLKESKRQAMSAVMNDLNARANPLIAQNQFIQAAEVYEWYQGAWADETASARTTRAAELRNRDRAFREQQKKLAEGADRQWQRLVDQVAALLVDGDIHAALIHVKQMADKTTLAPKTTELSDLLHLLSKASQMDQRILNSFRAQKDQAVTVALSKGVEKVIIRDVQDDLIQAEKIMVVDAGQVNQLKSFRVSDLALAEKRLRLGSNDVPEAALMQGILSVREKDFQSAESFFARTGPPLSPVLVAQLDERKKYQSEEQAKRVLWRTLRNAQIDLAQDNPTCQECVAAIQKRSFSAKESQALVKAVETYRANFGQTQFAQQYEPVLAALTHVRVTRAPEHEPASLPSKTPSLPTPVKTLSPATPEGVKTQLLERNPGMAEETAVFQPDESGKITRVELMSPALKDIRPLSALPYLREIICSAAPYNEWGEAPFVAPLSDLSPLKGLPLRELDVSNTMVKDMSVLIGMPLIKLNLAHTRVGEIIGLKGMPLIELNVKGTKIRDINVLRDMSLKYLNLSDTEVTDITPLKGLPLERLYMARLKVRDLAPLSGMRLSVLNINGTGMKDLSVLKTMPLTYLSVGHNKYADLSCLTGMALSYLDLSGTDIKDLSVLKGMPLKHLNLSGTRVRDLTQLQDLPLLEGLNISHTEVKDLTPLKTLPLKSLAIYGTAVKDWTPLQNSSIEHLWIDFNPYQPGERYWIAAVLRRMPMLRSVNDQPWGGFRKR